MGLPRSFGFWSLQYDDELNRNDMDYKTFHHTKELCYDMGEKKWVLYDECKDRIKWWPADFPCHSVKAAKRHLRKHNEIPKGTIFRLVSKYIGCDLYLTK